MTRDILAAAEAGFFGRLRNTAGKDWAGYVRHPFVEALGRGDLPAACFQHYLVQDYLFLIQFARAYALAGYKSETLEELRQAARGLSAISDMEMKLHVDYCRGWNLTEADMAATPEAMETIAYTRFVLDCGLRGDRLDLEVALAPCIIGYAEIGAILVSDPSTKLEGNPYRNWIESYSSPDYVDLALETIAKINAMASRRGGDTRFESLSATFSAATRLESAFWQMGLDASAKILTCNG